MVQEKVKYRLKGHESFILREGWLTKGLFAVHKNPGLFTENFGADELGVGTNMAKSIRYWMRCAGLIMEGAKSQVYLSRLGQWLLQQDAYFEDDFSLWLVHANIVRNFEQASTWYVFFNDYDQEHFTRKDMEQEIKEALYRRIKLSELSERSLQDDCEAVLQMYGKKQASGMSPEEKKFSPFYRLGLLREQDGIYYREQPDLKKMDALLVLFIMQEILEEEKGYYQISVDRLLRAEKSPGRILQIRRSFLLQYLEELQRRKYLTLNRTAGLDMVYQERRITQEEILTDYVEGK